MKNYTENKWLKWIGILFIFMTLEPLLRSLKMLSIGLVDLYTVSHVVIIVVIDIFAYRYLLSIWKQRAAQYPVSRKLTNDELIFKYNLQNHNGSPPIIFTYLGGSSEFNEAQKLYLVIDKSELSLNSENLSENLTISIDDLLVLEVSGPGKVKKDAGIIGGGFGIEGFIKGAVAAAVLNKITETSSTNTFLRIVTRDVEVNLHSSNIEPLELRNLLSPLYVKLEARKAVSHKFEELKEEVPTASIANEISKLNDLLANNVLSQEEFEQAKKMALGLDSNKR